MNECIIKREQFGIFRFFRVQKNWAKRITPHPPPEDQARLNRQRKNSKLPVYGSACVSADGSWIVGR
jgi:hypothetical protein